MKKWSIWKHVIPGLAIAALALYLTYRKTDTAQLAAVLRDMHWPILLLVFPPLFASYLFRILRWRVLLSPLGKVSAREATGPLVTGFFVNSLLPGRVGEVLRALLLSRKTSIPRAGSFATVVLARIFDGLTLAAMTLIVLAVLWSDLETTTRTGLVAAGTLYLVVLAVMVSLRRFREKAAAALAAPLRWVGLRSVASRFRELLISFSHGLETLRDIRETVRVILLSICVWGLLAVSVLPVFLAMELHMDWYYPILVLVLAGLGMLIPTPAGTGTVHGALVLVLPGLIGISLESARILALLFHTTQFLPVIVVGLVMAVREGVTASQLSTIAATEDEVMNDSEQITG